MKPSMTILGIIISLVLNSQILDAQPKLYIANLKTTTYLSCEISSEEEIALQRETSTDNELTVWLADMNGGLLERGDPIYIYNYSDSFNISSSSHEVQTWDPITWWQYTLALFDGGEEIFDGTKLNLMGNDWFSFTLVDFDQQKADNQRSKPIMITSTKSLE
jgi:hypothetical protein